MRIARIAVGSAAQPVVALERDGALYDVAELDRIFDTRFSPERMAGASDFHTRVLALAGAGLDALDDRLRAGDRPTSARVLPGDFVWLPPCDADRAHYVQMAAYEEASDEPLYRVADARALLGHDLVVAMPPRAGAPVFELGVAALLAEGVANASVEEAERAILGYAVLNAWSGSAAEPRPGWHAWTVPAQLGPVLVTKDEIGDVAALRAQARVDGAVLISTTLGGSTFSLAASIASVSRWTELRAGDVIGAGRVRGGRGEAAFGATVELVVERLGKLVGRPLRRAA